MATLYIAKRAFSGLLKFGAIYKHRQIVDLAFKMKKRLFLDTYFQVDKKEAVKSPVFISKYLVSI
jgi:hypothetical protein